MYNQSTILQKEAKDISLSHIHKGSFVFRDRIRKEPLELLKKSIKENGLQKPIVVRPIKTSNQLFDTKWSEVHYEIIDGQRRILCCIDLSFDHIRAVIIDLKDEEMFDFTMNDPDGETLNPIEKAKVFKRLSDDLKKTQDEIAISFNLKQQQVSEYIRLLDLPRELIEYTAQSILSLRHARELLKISDEATMSAIGKEVVEKKLSTRDLTDIVKRLYFDSKMVKNGSIKFEKIEKNDLFIENGDKKEVKTEDNGVSNEEIKMILDSFGEKNQKYDDISIRFSDTKSFPFLIHWILEGLGQLNSLILYGKMGILVKKHLQKQEGFENIRPEIYLAWIEICVLLPAVGGFVLFKLYPYIAIGFGAFFTSILLFNNIRKLYK